MTTALNFYKKYSKSELIELARVVYSDDNNQSPPGTSLYLLNPAARKKLAAIDQAIAYHMEDERNAAGNPVPTCGYSGKRMNGRVRR